MFTHIINHGIFLYYVYKTINDNKFADQLIKRTKKCGPLAIKLLQFILMRESINCEKLNFVFEENEVHSWEYTKSVYLRDFGKNLSEDYFIQSTIPIASGSIGQVYCLYSKSKNKYIAMKVKHPFNFIQFIKVIKITCYLTYYFNKFYNVILEYIDNVQTQLNYKQEAENTILLKEKWKFEETVIIPEIYGFSSDIIIMSYHDGDNYNNLTKKQQLITSLHMNYIFLTSMLVHDFIHADLHTGNWKITFNPMRIILYDCGIMCKTNDLEFNKQFMRVLFSGNYLDLLDFICQKNTPQKEICKRYFQENFVECSEGRLKMFINKLLEMRLVKDKNVISILNSFAVIGEIYKHGANIFNKHINDNNYEILVYNYIGILNKMDIFHELKTFLQDWMDSDKSHLNTYNNWLMENFGHTKGHIVSTILYKYFS